MTAGLRHTGRLVLGQHPVPGPGTLFAVGELLFEINLDAA